MKYDEKDYNPNLLMDINYCKCRVAQNNEEVEE